jgi:acetylornithine deacetylase/succinyl-diaminopimelate desuccinylase-like protein
MTAHTDEHPAGSEAIELLRRLIRNACVNDGTPESGQEHRSVETIAGYLGRMGETVEPVPGRRSVAYRVPGRDPGAPRLALMGHTDVVPVNEAGWSRDPFGAEIEDGFVWGRGAIDMLNLTAAMAVAFKPYLTGDRPPPPGDLIYLAVADEEAAGTLGAAHLVRERWDLVATDYLLTEIAYPPLSTADGPGYPVSVGEKGPFWSVLRTTGTPGHGSVPYGAQNALEPMAAALHGLFSTPQPVSIGPDWRAFVDALGLDPTLARDLTDPDRIDLAIDRLAADDPRLAAYVHACTHMTISPNVARVGVKSNMVPDRGTVQVDVRALPGHERGDVDQHLRKAMGAAADRVEIEPVADHPAGASGTSNLLWDTVVASIEDLTGSRRVVPTLMPAATDARFFRDRGVTAFGVGLFDDRVSFPEFLGMFHGNDERVSTASMHATTRLLGRILERWTST